MKRFIVKYAMSAKLYRFFRAGRFKGLELNIMKGKE